VRDPGTVLITGASGGIGSALAGVYAAPGRRLILHGQRESVLESLAASCRAAGAVVETKALDLRDTARAMDWLQSLADVDLAIVSAGVSSSGAARERWEAIDEAIEVNVRAAIATVSALLPAMRARGAGQIAFLSSLSAWYGLPVTPIYSASKAALKVYGEALRGWLSPYGIEVSVVLPGFVRTPMTDRFPGPRPFLVDPRDAAARIARGLAANRARISFPFPLALGMRCLAALPAPLAQRLIRAFGFGD
jgi:short-subunit dehydrogenase